MLETPQTQLCAVTIENNHKNPQNEEYGILLVVPAWVFGHEIRVLIDSSATRNFISLASVTKCGLKVESHDTFLELGDYTKMLSGGYAVNIPILTASYLMKTNSMVCSLLHEVDLVLDMTWLVEVNPLIFWSIGTVYLPNSISSFQKIMGDWLDKQVKVGTVKVLSTNDDLEISEEALKCCFFKKFEIPSILGYEGSGDSELLEQFSCPRGYSDC